MSTSVTLRSLPSVKNDLPFSLASIYSGHSRGRYPWVVGRTDPTGQASKTLWIDVDCFNEWAACRGIKSKLAGGQR